MKPYGALGKPEDHGDFRVLEDGRTVVEVPVVGQYSQDVVRSSDGLLWVSAHGSQDALALNHEMYPPGRSIHDYICGHFGPGVVFLDIGAHVGHYALRAAQAGCVVYAVEANPECAAHLRLNMILNKIDTVTLWVVAAWNQRKFLELNAGPEDVLMRSGGNSVMPPDARPGMERRDLGVTVAAVPLDELLGEVDRLDLVKMDVEGADLQVLEGMLESLARLRPKLIIEDHSLYGYFDPAEFDLMQQRLAAELGYRWTTAEAEGVEVTLNYRIGVPQ